MRALSKTDGGVAGLRLRSLNSGLAMVFATASLAALGAGIWLSRAAPGDEAEALAIVPRAADLGAVVPGDRPVASFQLTNRSNEAMTIAGVRADCGCTEAKADRSSIAPGELATVTAVLDTSALRGPVERHVVVQYTLPGDSVPRQRVLTIRAAVKEALRIVPRTIDFELGSSQSQTAELVMVAAAPVFRMGKAYATHGAVSILHCTAGGVKPDREQVWNMGIGFDASKCDPRVPFHCAIVIPSGSPTEPDYRVPITIALPRAPAAEDGR